jgi:hypothetical protein
MTNKKTTMTHKALSCLKSWENFKWAIFMMIDTHKKIKAYTAKLTKMDEKRRKMVTIMTTIAKSFVRGSSL